jgi:hypothetical protein
MKKTIQAKPPILDLEPIHTWFELSYCSYLVLPRSILQSAPVKLQRKIVDCLNELEELFGNVPENGHYEVYLKDEHNRYMHDGYMHYERGRRQIPFIKSPIPCDKTVHKEK